MSKARELANLGNAYSDGALSSRNWIINGDPQISQRGDYSSATAVSNGGYYLDRWQVFNDVASTIQRTTDTPSGSFFSYSQKLAATASGTGGLSLVQKIENYSNFASQVVTVSAWVKSNSSEARLLIYEGTGWNSATVSHSGGGSWEQLSVTATVASGANALRVYAAIRSAAAGSVSLSSGDYIQITGVQLEVGDTATPFEHRSYGDELARCQRYYEQLSGNGGEMVSGVGQAFSSSSGETAVIYKVEKRAAPTITTSGNFQVWLGNGSANSTSNSFFEVRTTQATWGYGGATAGSTGQAIQFYANGGFSSIKIDAEL